MRVGVIVQCSVQTYDRFGNKQGAESDTDLFKLESVRGSLVKPASLLFVEVGVLQGLLTFSSSGFVDCALSATTNSFATETNVEVAAGDIDINLSYFKCPEESPGSANVDCVVHVRDSFNNIALSTDAAASHFYIQLTNMPELTLTKINVKGKTEDGQFAISFGGPSTGTITVAIFYGGQQVGEAQSIKMIAIDLSSTFSTVYCPKSVVVGDSVTCQIYCKDSSQKAIGDASLAASFDFTVKLKGRVMSVTDISAFQLGIFRGRFIPTVVGEASITIEVRLGDKHIFISSDGKDSGASSSVSVTAGRIVASESVVICDEASTVAAAIKCYLYGRDIFGNPTGSSLDAAAFTAVASTQEGIEEALKVVYVDGIFEFEFTPYLSTAYTLQAWFREAPITKWADGKTYHKVGTITAKPEAISAPGSSFFCPVEAPGLAMVTCTTVVRDAYGNRAFNGHEQATQFYVSLSGTDGPTIATINADSTTMGTYLIRFKAPLSGQIQVEVSFNGESLMAPNPQTVVAAPVDISPADSEVICPTTAIAGDGIVCRILTRDSNRELIGSAGMADAFVTDIQVNGGKLDAERISFLATGRYQMRVLSTVATTLSILVQFRTADGLCTLGTAGAVKISAGSVSASQSYATCDTTAVAGSLISCKLYGLDSFGNNAGTADVLTAFDGQLTNADGTLMNSDSVAWDDGHITMRFISTVSGLAKVAFTFQDEPIGTPDSEVQVINSKISAVHSTILCPDKAIVGSLLTCVIVCNDMYGNPAVSVTGEVERHFFISADNSKRPPPFVQVNGVSNARLSFSLISNEVGDIVISGRFASQDLSNVVVVSAELSAISSKLSTLNCEVWGVAGSSVSCFILALDAKGAKTGEASSANAFKVDIMSNGLKTSSQISFIERGLYTINFVPSRAGSSRVSVELDSGVIGSVSVAVSAGPILGNMTSVVCMSKQYQAGDKIVCNVYSADKFGNPVGSIDARDAFSVELADDTGRTLLTRKVEYLKEGMYTLSGLSHSMIGSYFIRVYYNDVVVPQTAVIELTPGSIQFASTRFVCDDVSTVGGSVECKIRTYDAYQNPVSPSLAHRNSFMFNVLAGSSSPDVKFTMDGVNGEYIVSYTVASVGDAELSAVVGNVKFGPFVTAVQATLISASKSFVNCPVTSIDEPIEAGGAIVCYVSARNSNDLKEGGKESVGSLVAFSASSGIKSYGRIEYVSLGLYKAIFTLVKSGVSAISVKVQGLDTTEAIGETPDNVIVSPGRMNCQQSYITCPVSATAGVEFSCLIESLDAFQNPTGGEAELESFSLFLESALTQKVGRMSFLRQGLYEAFFSTTETNYNNIIVKNQECVLQTKTGTLAVVETLPSDISPENSFYGCMPEIVVGAPVTCVVSVFDEYGNKAGSTDSLSGVNVIVSIGNEFVAAAVNFLEVSRLSVTFVPDKLGAVSVLVKYEGAALRYQALENDRRGRRLTSGAITVQQGSICAGTSTVVCSSSVTAGQIIACTIYTFDCDGVATGADFESGSVVGQVVQGGAVKCTMAVGFGSFGVFQASLLATTARDGQYMFAMRVVEEDNGRRNARRLGIKLNEISAVAPASVVISAAKTSAEHTKVHCAASASAGVVTECVVNPCDAFGNPSGTIDDIKAFSAVVSTARGHSADADLAFVGANELKFSFIVTEAGLARVAVQYLGRDVGYPADDIGVTSGEAVITNSHFSCPPVVIVFSTASCSMVLKDQFGNPTNTGVAQSDITVTVVVDSTYTSTSGADFEVVLEETNIEGELLVKFVMSQRIGTAVVTMHVVDAPLNVLSASSRRLTLGDTISVEQGSFEPTLSTVVCPDDVVAGSASMCSIFGVDKDGEAAGIAAEASVFTAEVTESSGEKVTAEVVYFLDGLFKLKFQLQTSGAATVNVRYLNVVVGSTETIAVSPAGISAATSEVSCPSEGNVVAIQIQCNLTAKDEFGNPSGGSEDASGFAAVIATGDAVPTEATIAFQNSDVGDYFIRFTVTRSGDAVVTASYNRVPFLLTETLIIAASAASASKSSIVCPTQLVAFAVGSCTIFALDEYGNPASTTNLGVTVEDSGGSSLEVSISKSNSVGDYFTFVTPSMSDATFVLVTGKISNDNINDVKNPQINIIEGNIDATKSRIDCPSSGTVGVGISCMIYGRNNAGATDGIEAEASAFIGTVSGGRNQMADTPLRTPVYFDVGLYQVLILVETSGDYNVAMTYATAVVGIEAISFAPAAISVAHTYLECPEVAVVGSIAVCQIFVQDEFGNPTGTSEALTDSSFEVAAVNLQEYEKAVLEYSGTVGKFLIAYTGVKKGTVTAAAKLYGLPILAEGGAGLEAFLVVERGKITASTASITLEEGSSSEISLVLDREPSHAVKLRVVLNGYNSTVSVEPVSLEFDKDNWDVAKPITVSYPNDDVFVSDHKIELTFGIDTVTTSFTVATVPVIELHINDDDVVGLVLSRDVLYARNGDTLQYSIELSSEPQEDVQIDVSFDQSDVPVNFQLESTTLTFTVANWNVPQNLVLNIGENLSHDVWTPVQLVHTVTSGDKYYSSLSKSVNLYVGVAVSLSQATCTLDEADEGAVCTYSIKLATMPKANVVIELSNDSPDFLASAKNVTFAMDNWNVEQSVEISVVNDFVDEGDLAGGLHDGKSMTSTLIHRVVSDDADYDQLIDLEMIVTVNDDDVASGVITPDWLALLPGRSEDYTIRLGSEPTANVTLSISHSRFTFEPNDALVFTSLNWNQDVQMNVKASADDYEVFERHFIVYDVTSEDPYYLGLETIKFTILVGNTLVLSDLRGEVTEGGGPIFYQITLVREPTADVVVTMLYDDKEITVNPKTVEFSRENWNRLRYVEVQARDDREDEGGQFASIKHAVASEDRRYSLSNVEMVEFVVQIVDNDEWTADRDDVVSVDWDGILAQYHLQDGTVKVSDVVALISSSRGPDFKVELLSRIVKSSPESVLIVTDTLARETPELLVRAGGAIVRAVPHALFAIADTVIGGLLSNRKFDDASDDTAQLVTNVIGGLLDAAMDTMEDTFPGQTPASVLAMVQQQHPEWRETFVKAVQSRSLAHVQATLGDEEDALFSVGSITGTVSLRVPREAVSSGRRLSEGSVDKHIDIRVYDCGLVSTTQLKGECIGIEPSWNTETEPLQAPVTLEFPSGEETNICIKSTDEVSNNWYKVNCNIVNGIAIYTTTSFSVLSTGTESFSSNNPVTMFYRDIADGGISSRNKEGRTTEVSQERGARFLGIAVDTKKSDVYYSDGQSIQVFSMSTPGTIKVLASAFVKVTIHGHNFGATAANILSIKISGYGCSLLTHSENMLECTITEVGAQNRVHAGTTSAANVALSTSDGFAMGAEVDPSLRLYEGFTGPLIVSAAFEVDSFQPYALALELTKGYVVWSNVHEGKIQRSTLTGGFARDLVSDGVMRCFGLVALNGYIYYTDANQNSVSKVHVDGDETPEVVVRDLEYPRGLAVYNDQLYVAEFEGRIIKINADGSNLEQNAMKSPRFFETVLELSSQVRLDGIAVGKIGGKMRLIWTEMNLNRLSTATLHGTDPKIIVEGRPLLIWPRQVTYVDGFIYFTEFLGRIRKTDLRDYSTSLIVDATASDAAKDIMLQFEDAWQKRDATGGQQIFFAIEEF